MGGFRDENYIKEFACRTKMNYYNILEQDSKSRLIAQNEKNKLRSLMHDMGYPICNYYEVTQLLNSLLGLLIFPEQTYYDFLPTNNNNLKIIKNLHKYQRDNTCNTTYLNKNWKKEIINEKVVLRHMRNAVCHDKVSIKPLSREGHVDISDIEFVDEYFCPEKKMTFKFQIVLPVNDLEDIVMNLCDFIMSIPNDKLEKKNKQ